MSVWIAAVETPSLVSTRSGNRDQRVLEESFVFNTCIISHVSIQAAENPSLPWCLSLLVDRYTRVCSTVCRPNPKFIPSCAAFSRKTQDMP